MQAKTLTLLVLIAALISGGCALKPREPYDNIEKAMLGLVVVGQGFDYVSTQNALDRDCVEANPLMENEGVFIASKVGVSLMAYFTANALDNHAHRKLLLGAVSALGLGTGAYNSSVKCH